MKNKTIATTRFNNKTYDENRKYNHLISPVGCIYGTPIKMKTTIPLESIVYVIEMNNSINKIEGIGVITNKEVIDKTYRIYEDMDYNRYIYKGSKHISTTEIIDEYDKQVIYVLEQLLFKTKKHCKRAQGITQLQKRILDNKYGFDFVKAIECIFKNVKNKKGLHIISNTR